MASNEIIDNLAEKEYEFGFETDIEMNILPKGLNEDIIRKISALKNEPKFMLEWRLKAYRYWLGMKLPVWANLKFKEPDYQALSYYAAPKKFRNITVWMRLILNF